MPGFCDEAWRRTAKLQQSVLAHPFNEELAAGTLSPERFQFYLAQDARYLIGFGRALAVAATRAPDPADLSFFAGAAREAVVVERALHEGYFEKFGLSEADLDAIETSPTCLAYTSYLLAVAQAGSYPELIAALLPCFWIYQHVGEHILANQSGDAENPYQAWIDTYADDEFAAAVTSCREAVDRAAESADEVTRSRMFSAFTRACEYEWLFWDSAHRMEAWPTAHLR
ncbi:thiaminase II [Amycolatopsis albispora]|uniref:Aminopyrimidine aminohydrolase n=1 Tax=Amycolatopsis albispora TaxID=1804986 RepID=A0A344LCZ8_9PSEU|nr:thiaminase II [Amycolatopsis albispora]AXB45922.1 thiaminase II [Amycolatopsis albispora]